ncbi:MAG: bifunctional phosphoribosyl-AMP cyclohydrolase/phosphoribosyl-ATP diphosphatase HisIE [Lachnospiraceae bacterium]
MVEYMSGTIALIPRVYVRGARASAGKAGAFEEEFLTLAQRWDHNGADGILVVDCSEGDREHDQAIEACKEIVRNTSLELFMAGNIKRLEDVKKYLYTGAKQVLIDPHAETETAVSAEAEERFGGDRVAVEDYDGETAAVSGLDSWMEGAGLGTENGHLFLDLEGRDVDFYAVKRKMKQKGIPVITYEPKISWEQFRLNSDGLMPVVVQDYRTEEVLMVAYMDEPAFQETVESGKMCYYSRSRRERWLKGETSGHYQYVKALYLDCDNDTILAKVAQVGAACHTGSYSCFFQEILDRHADGANPHKVLEDVYGVIEDRKVHPKEGSYTNYLFDKGIDKILKKCGEEATEIVIAAKNPDPEEIKYEISDFLYHLMVLMVEKQVTWEDIMRELANR